MDINGIITEHFRNILELKMPLSYLRGIFERCLAESNRCSRFCRPVPNRSAKAPFPYWDCKYTDFYLNCKIYFRILATYGILLSFKELSNTNQELRYQATRHTEEVLSDTPLLDDRYSPSGRTAGSACQGCVRCGRIVQQQRTLQAQMPLYQPPASSCM